MSDFLLENQAARRLIKTLGLPVPVPPRLQRAKGPWVERPLHDEHIAVGGSVVTALTPVIARTLTAAGAWPVLAQPELRPSFEALGEAFGRPAKLFGAVSDTTRFRGLVFDATQLHRPSELRALFDFYAPLVRRMTPCGRIVVIGRPPRGVDSVQAAATQAALEGYTRSIAKELGKRGTTAGIVYVDSGAEEHAEGVLRWLLSPRSAFISGQPWYVSATVGAAAPVQWTRSLQGKTALVTGAARGIGEATAELLAGEGAHVICLDRPEDSALVSQVARRINGSVLLADLASPEAANIVIDGLKGEHDGLDIVIHNAGITRDKTLAKMRPEAWDQVLQVNLSSVVTITSALLEGPLRDGGRILCLSSVSGIAGNMGQTNYAASKAGIGGYVRALSQHVAKRGITVNAVAPGFIETRLTAAIPVVIREAARRLSNLGQGGTPQDVGEALTFLASPQASGVTGQVLRVCGGALVGA